MREILDATNSYEARHVQRPNETTLRRSLDDRFT